MEISSSAQIYNIYIFIYTKYTHGWTLSVFVEKFLLKKGPYLNYIIKPIFNNFDEFYSQLKKLEKENLNLLNKKNENSLNLNNQRLELFKIKADEESQNAKNKKELFKSQKNLEEVKLKNQDLKDKLNRLILKIKKDNIPKIKKEIIM